MESTSSPQAHSFSFGSSVPSGSSSKPNSEHNSKSPNSGGFGSQTTFSSFTPTFMPSTLPSFGGSSTSSFGFGGSSTSSFGFGGFSPSTGFSFGKASSGFGFGGLSTTQSSTDKLNEVLIKLQTIQNMIQGFDDRLQKLEQIINKQNEQAK